MHFVLVDAFEDEVIEARGRCTGALDDLEQRGRLQTIAIEPHQEVVEKRRKPSRAMTQKSSP